MSTETLEKFVNIQTGKELDFNIVSLLPDNAMLKHRPDLWIEWDFEKNIKLELDIYKLTYGSKHKVWWICPKCKSSYDASIQNRVINNNNCPYCSGRRVNHTNSLATLNPQLASEWHPILNGELTPHDVTCGSHEKVWWLGECRHSFDMKVDFRSRGKGCSYCKGNHRILIGFNDMWTTNPELAKQLLNPEDGYKYTQSSGRKVDWKCLNCDKVIKNKCIRDISRSGLNCEICSDKFHYPEKVMSAFLTAIGIDFVSQTSFKWSDRKIYDFYLPEHNMIIEVHGEQHFRQAEGVFKHRSIEEEQENDRYKEQLAKDNGIDKYVIIDCRKSYLSFIRSNIEKSLLGSIFNISNIDWNSIEFDARKSKHVEVLNLWKSGMPIIEIAIKIKYTKTTVRQILHKFTAQGLCDYGLPKAIVQKDLNGNVIKEWDSIEEIKLDGVFDRTAIIRICNGRKSSHKGYYWEYKDIRQL